MERTGRLTALQEHASRFRQRRMQHPGAWAPDGSVIGRHIPDQALNSPTVGSAVGRLRNSPGEFAPAFRAPGPGRPAEPKDADIPRARGTTTPPEARLGAPGGPAEWVPPPANPSRLRILEFMGVYYTPGMSRRICCIRIQQMPRQMLASGRLASSPQTGVRAARMTKPVEGLTLPAMEGARDNEGFDGA